MEFHRDYAEKIKRFWTVFEVQAIEESYKVEMAAAVSADKGDVAGARAILTDFVNKKWAGATSLGKQWVKTLKELPLSA